MTNSLIDQYSKKERLAKAIELRNAGVTLGAHPPERGIGQPMNKTAETFVRKMK